MKYDTIILGGGLSGLMAGLTLQKGGQHTAIVSGGQSALHFWSGSFQYLRDHNAELSPTHPYERIGRERTLRLLGGVPDLMREAGLTVHGSTDHNHYHITPTGFFEPAWLTVDDYMRFDAPEGPLPFKTAAIVNISGYIDFYPLFLAKGLGERGVKCAIHSVDTPAIDFVRQSCTEMRATNVARVFDDEAIAKLARVVESASRESEVIFMPAILGMFSEEPVRKFREQVSRPVWFVPTIPASVPGTRCQLRLRDLYTNLGGRFMLGDNAVGGEARDGKLHKIYTENLGDMALEADHFMWCSGSFFGHGLIADINHIYEPVMGLDLDLNTDRTGWYREDFFEAQPYMSAGLVTDEHLRPSLHGRTLENVYAAGAVLGGFNALKEGSGAGITIATALAGAENILKGL